ncbi:MAG: sugar nucleotide-binding protein, partial [Rubrivivax sp.]|nr:sugar nucleotide-binding protein [Rubrivivax sp.]
MQDAANAAGTVVVLGASGLLGQALMHELARRGQKAVALSRRQGVDLAALPSVSALAEELDPHAPSLVVNAAAITDLAHCEERPQDAWLLHARLPGLLAHWSRCSGVPWVQVSTDHYFSGSANVLHDENAPVAPPNEYARSKFAGEALALTSPLALVLRTNIVGRRGWPALPSFAEWVLAALQGGKPFPGYTDAWASSLEAGQCAAALLDLAGAGHRGLLNVAASESVSKADFITALAQALCLDDGPMKRQHRPTPAGANGL